MPRKQARAAQCFASVGDCIAVWQALAIDISVRGVPPIKYVQILPPLAEVSGLQEGASEVYFCSHIHTY